jgi:hypothetical protein
VGQPGHDRGAVSRLGTRFLEANPTVQIQWSEVETRHWRAVCQCGSEDVYEEPTDRRVRLNPHDPSTFRHAGQCEHRYTSDPALLRAILKDGTARARATGGWNAAPAIVAGRFRTTPPRRWASGGCSMRTRRWSCSTSKSASRNMPTSTARSVLSSSQSISSSAKARLSV